MKSNKSIEFLQSVRNQGNHNHSQELVITIPVRVHKLYNIKAGQHYKISLEKVKKK